MNSRLAVSQGFVEVSKFQDFRAKEDSKAMNLQRSSVFWPPQDPILWVIGCLCASSDEIPPLHSNLSLLSCHW